MRTLLMAMAAMVVSAAFVLLVLLVLVILAWIVLSAFNAGARSRSSVAAPVGLGDRGHTDRRPAAGVRADEGRGGADVLRAAGREQASLACCCWWRWSGS